jgi:hypothetical protein
MDFIFRELKPGERPEVIRAGFLEYMKPRWDVFSDPRWTKGKSTYAVWFLHMLTYFIEAVMPRLQRVEAIHQHASSGPDESNNLEAVEIVLTKEPGDDEPPPGPIEEITL